ncbi:MAG: hypothetical protein OHK0046_47490 [Anaerolineae bacterium]
MKTGEVAKRLKIDRKTITDWVERFPEFFSPGAKQEHGELQRDFSAEDERVLVTINHIRSVEKITDWDVIRSRLDNGERKSSPWIEVSEDVIPIHRAQETAKLLAENAAIRAELDNTREQLERAERESARLREEAGREKERLLREIADLYKQIGRLEAQLENKSQGD